MAGWYWWLVLVYEYIEGVFERVEDIFKKRWKKTEHWDVRLVGYF